MTRDSRPFLSPSKTAEYSRSSMGYALGSAAITGTVASPVFLLAYCEIMRRDPQIEFGTGIIMAPLYTVTWTVKCERPEVAAYVDRTLHTFWKSLARLEWLVTFGHVGGEVEWKEENGLIELSRLKDFHPNDCRPLVWQGKLCGVVVKGVRGEERIAPPRSVWGVSRPEAGSWYGRGRMQGPYLPWLEKSGRHGALDVRRSWAIRCAFDGGTMYYPPGTTLMEDGVTQKPNQDIAREIIEKKETGGVLALPNTTTEDGGKKAWEYVPPVINGSFVELLEYPKGLDVEILKGMNIPPEVVQAAETGSGWSGRSVPFLVFLTGEDQLADTLVQLAKEQVIDHGVEVNFGTVPYTIELVPLAKLAEAPPPGAEPPKPGAAKPAEEKKPVVAHQPPRPANLSADWDESKHERASDGKFGKGSGGKTETTKRPPPQKSLHEHGASIARSAYADTRKIIEGLHGGEYDAADAAEDIDLVVKKAAEESQHNYKSRYQNWRDYAAETFGAETVDSTEWLRVRRAFTKPLQAAEALIQRFKTTGERATGILSLGETVPVNQLVHEAGQIQDKLAEVYEKSVHTIADALEAFLAAHGKKKTAAEFSADAAEWIERPPAERPPIPAPAPVEVPAVVPATFYARTLGMMERMFRRQRREAKP